MVDVFNHSVRVRLPEFQKWYKRGFNFIILFLALSASVIIFHKLSYELLGNTDKHFAKGIYAPYLLSKQLIKEEVPCYEGIRERERYQLRYYGILSCSN